MRTSELTNSVKYALSREICCSPGLQTRGFSARDQETPASEEAANSSIRNETL